MGRTPLNGCSHSVRTDTSLTYPRDGQLVDPRRGLDLHDVAYPVADERLPDGGLYGYLTFEGRGFDRANDLVPLLAIGLGVSTGLDGSFGRSSPVIGPWGRLIRWTEMSRVRSVRHRHRMTQSATGRHGF